MDGLRNEIEWPEERPSPEMKIGSAGPCHGRFLLIFSPFFFNDLWLFSEELPSRRNELFRLLFA